MDSDEVAMGLVLVALIAFLIWAMSWAAEQGKKETAFEECRIERAIDIRLKEPVVRTCVDPSP